MKTVFREGFNFLLLKTNHEFEFLCIFKKSKLKEKSSVSLGQNICRLFHNLVHFCFTKSETELDYSQQKVNAQVTSRDDK